MGGLVPPHCPLGVRWGVRWGALCCCRVDHFKSEKGREHWALPAVTGGTPAADAGRPPLPPAPPDLDLPPQLLHRPPSVDSTAPLITSGTGPPRWVCSLLSTGVVRFHRGLLLLCPQQDRSQLFEPTASVTPTHLLSTQRPQVPGCLWPGAWLLGCVGRLLSYGDTEEKEEHTREGRQRGREGRTPMRGTTRWGPAGRLPL